MISYIVCHTQFKALSEEEIKKLSEEAKKAKEELQQKTAIISGLNVSQKQSHAGYDTSVGVH